MTHEEITRMTEEQRFDALCKDFLERDGNTFVRVKRNEVLGWDDEIIRRGDAFNTYFGKYKTDIELIEGAYEMAKNTLSMMGIPYKVKLSIIPGSDQSMTDRKTVWVATKHFDDNTLTPDEKADIFRGLTIHEGGHLLYTDWTAYKGLENDANAKLVKYLENLIEDEREERCVGEDLHGLANFLGPVKKYYFKKKEEGISDAEQNMSDDEKAVTEILNTLFNIIRFPISADPALVRKHSALLLDIRENVLTPYPSSTAESLAAAKHIVDMLKQYCQEELNRPDLPESMQGGGEGEGQDGEGQSSVVVINSAGNGGQGQGAGQGQGSGQGAAGGTIVVDLNPNAQGQGGGTPARIDPNTMQKILDAVANKIAPTMEDINATEQQMNDKDQEAAKTSNTVVRNISEVKKMQGDILGVGAGGCEIIDMKKMSRNESLYKSSFKRIEKYIPAMRRQLASHGRDVVRQVGGYRTGELDTHKLVAVRAGSQTVFSKTVEDKADRMSVALLIDESGSMHGNREQSARDSAVLVSNALSGLQNVDVYIYGFSDGFYVYQEGGNKPSHALGQISARRGTPMANALKILDKRVRKHTQDKVLLMVMTDGEPSYPDEVARVIKAMEKKNYEFVGVGIQHDVAHLFKNNFTVCNMNDFSKRIGTTIKQALMKKTKRHSRTM